MRLFWVVLALLGGSAAQAATALVLPPIARGKRADWKAAGAVEKALEAALGTEADIVTTSAAAARDKTIGKKTIGCGGDAACLGALAHAFAADSVLAAVVQGRGKRQTVVLDLIGKDGSKKDRWQGKVRDAGAQATRMVVALRQAAAKVAAAAQPTAPAERASDDEDDERDAVAIMAIEVTGGDPGLGSRLVDSAALGVSELKAFRVISAEDIKKMLDQEQLKEVMNCGSDSCLADIGGALDTRFLLSGKAVLVEGELQVNLTLMDVEAAKVVARGARSMVPKNIEKEMPGMAKKMFNPILAKEGGVVMIRCTEIGASLLIDGDMVASCTGRTVKRAVPGGVHRIEAKKNGFVTWGKDIEVGAKSEQTIEVELVPSQDFIRSRVAASRSKRIVGMVVGGVSIGLVGGAGYFQMQAQEAFAAGAKVMNEGCGGGSCLADGAEFETQSGNHTLDVNPAATGFAQARDDYASKIELQQKAVLGAQVTAGLAGATAIYGLWSYLSAEDTTQWERFIIDEEPKTAQGAAPAKLAMGD